VAEIKNHTAYGCPKNALCEGIDERAMLVAAAAFVGRAGTIMKSASVVAGRAQ